MPETLTKTDFKRVLLFKAGKFNGVTTTPDDLRSMVAFALEHDNILPDLKLDHIDDKDKRDSKFKVFENFPFSLGKITNLYYSEVEQALYGDYINVFAPVRNALDDKLLTTHSAEIYYNVKSKKTGKKYPAVLTAVAILPAGKPPALMEVFEPYMYELENYKNDLSDFNDIEYSEKIYYSIGGDKMTKEDYEAKMDGFGCGKKRMSYESYAKLSDDEKDDYMNMMRDKFKNKEKNKGDKMDEKEKPEMAKFNLDEVLEKNAELEKKLNALVEAEGKRAENLEARILDYEKREKSGRVEKIIYSLSDPNSAKLLPAMADKARALLMSADDSKKVSYTLDGSNVEKSQFELMNDFLNALPENKQVFSTNSIVANQDDITVSENEIKGGLSVDSILASKKITKKYGAEKDLSNMSESELLKLYAAEGVI